MDWFGSTIHISNTLQGITSLRKPLLSEQGIYSGIKMRSHVEAVWTCNFALSSGFVLNLEKTFYVPSFSRNLISISRLVPLGHSLNFMKRISICFINLILLEMEYYLMVFSQFICKIMPLIMLCVHAGTKRCVINKESSILWHRRLGHISIQWIKRLVNDGVIDTLDFTDFETCVNCIKAKQTNTYKKGVKRSSKILEIIHSDICCPDMDISDPKFFTSFIDEYYSRYMHVY